MISFKSINCKKKEMKGVLQNKRCLIYHLFRFRSIELSLKGHIYHL